MKYSLEIPKNPPQRDSEVVREIAIRNSHYSAFNRATEAVRKAAFHLTNTQKRLIPIVGQHLYNPDAEVYSAYYTGLELAIACAITEKESTGRNIYGGDPASAWMNTGPYGRLWESPVTNQNYAWFKSRVLAGNVSNGVGPKQLTSVGLLLAADARGGAWIPQHNMAEGDRFFLALLNESGGNVWTAAFHYNGSAAYANDFVNVVAKWRTRVP